MNYYEEKLQSTVNQIIVAGSEIQYTPRTQVAMIRDVIADVHHDSYRLHCTGYDRGLNTKISIQGADYICYLVDLIKQIFKNRQKILFNYNLSYIEKMADTMTNSYALLTLEVAFESLLIENDPVPRELAELVRKVERKLRECRAEHNREWAEWA